LAKLEEVLEYLGVFDPTRDGSLRVDANVSLVPESEVAADGTISDDALADVNRAEVKNISSHKGAEQALAYEVTRQENVLRRGREIEQETRHWDEARGVTVSMRSKEAEKDYRYFREADLPALEVSDWKSQIPIPELPDARRRERFREEYGLSTANRPRSSPRRRRWPTSSRTWPSSSTPNSPRRGSPTTSSASSTTGRCRLRTWRTASTSSNA